MSVTSDFLLKGYALALEQCGLLLRAAVLLYKDKSYSNAVALAAFAREELGRSQILLDLWRQRLGGSPVTTDDTEKTCEDHVDPNAAVDEIIARCGGDMRGAVEALLLVNEQLELELDRVHTAAAFGWRTERRAKCTLH